MEQKNRDLAASLKQHVYTLSHEIGDRSVHNYDKLCEAAAYISGQFASFGYDVSFQKYMILGREVSNISVIKTGVKHPARKIIIGAHYDTALNPGADDNASGIAGLLELARFIADKQTDCTLKFIAFPAEEPPFFDSDDMGSWVYAKSARAGNKDIRAVLILEMIGYYSSRARSQTYPTFFRFLFPHAGNFISVLGNIRSAWLVFKILSSFKKVSRFPIVPMVVFNFASAVHFSDHWAFWTEGYRAVMISDTSFYRNRRYHTQADTYDTLDYASMAEVVQGLYGTLLKLAN
jgi:Zn-dependent M28 family amino/carboxypeptidase